MAKFFATLDGIKRAARRLKREAKVPYRHALELTAREAGFPNYQIAHDRYAALEVSPADHPVTICQYWFDRQAGRPGKETLTIRLPLSIRELVKPHHLVGYLGGVTMDDENGLIGYDRAEDLDHARMLICRLARTLQFMVATGLKPSRSSRCYPKGDWHNRHPGADHDTAWYDPATRTHILTDEPYPGRHQMYREENKLWCERHQFEIVKSRWASVYGLGTELYLVGKRGGAVDLDALALGLVRGPGPIEERDWGRQVHSISLSE